MLPLKSAWPGASCPSGIGRPVGIRFLWFIGTGAKDRQPIEGGLGKSWCAKRIEKPRLAGEPLGDRRLLPAEDRGMIAKWGLETRNQRLEKAW